MWVGVDAPSRAGADDDPEFQIPIRDQVAVVVEAPFELYLYVATVTPDGRARLLWPPDSPRTVDGFVRVPGDGWVHLEEQDALAIVAVRQGEPNEFDGVLARVSRAREYGAYEGTYVTSLTWARDGMFADVWAEDETVILLDFDRR